MVKEGFAEIGREAETGMIRRIETKSNEEKLKEGKNVQVGEWARPMTAHHGTRVTLNSKK